MGTLEGKVAVITGGSSGMALASAKRFVEEGAYAFNTGRRQEALDEVPDPAVKIGRPEEIVTVELFLASGDASCVNGVELTLRLPCWV